MVRAETPPAIIDKLHTDIASVLESPDVKARLARDGAEISGMRPQQFSAYIENEIAKWAKVVKAAGIRAQ